MSRSAAGSQSALREANTAKIVDAVKRFGGLTQVELAEATALSAATISAIVKELSLTGLVETRPTSRSGRRAQLVTMARRSGLVIAAHVTARAIRVRIADTAQEILEERRLPLPPDHPMDTVLDRTAVLIFEMLQMIGSEPDELLGVCLTIPAPIDPATGMITFSGLMPGWEDAPIAPILSQRLGCPVIVENDANMAALAEATLGAARGVADSITVVASDGTGAGIVIDSRLHRGADGTAGEIGHIQIDPQGQICRCGLRGCLDTVVGASALLAPLRSHYGNLTFRDVVSQAAAGDQGCRRVVADAGSTIGRVVAGLAQGIGTGLIVVGGELAQAGDAFFDAFSTAVREHVNTGRHREMVIMQSTLPPDSVLAGALVEIIQTTDVLQRFEERT
ncbi:ROK family transcriptional regulator [Microbacterium sp. LWH12-1.2]|uniref:ROK family transcriptional regulator n=1 Tax=Microbacterium sp. LWH12-1.2 TaxID=3135259 RepID=UPI003423F08C